MRETATLSAIHAACGPTMDSSSKRSSFEEACLAASALRRWTRSPTGHRLGLRRSGTGSTSSASVASFESDRNPSTCVARDTSSEDCSLHRFIVWVAVKRNASPTITAEQMRECPMLRCRRPFPNHESMLQHLYSCEHLESSEYWCYDCCKAEQLADIKCRRCLGHPSKRKRMMSMARSFFNSLGHKSKSGSLPDLDLDLKDDLPSYEPAFAPPEAELQSTEIHEIDSFELPLATIPEAREEPDPYTAYISNMPSLTAEGLVQQHPADVGNVCAVIDESLINWDLSPTPPPPAPTLPSHESSRPGPPAAQDRPILQLNTQGLAGYYRARSRRRSKTGMLAPSSSVRSTASTASTNSTSSTASHNISPMSAWSGSWSKAPGFDSALTSPADDLNLADVFPEDNNEYRRQAVSTTAELNFQNVAVETAIQELPAEVPTFHLPHMASAPHIESQLHPAPVSEELSLDVKPVSDDAIQSLTTMLDTSRTQHVSAPALIHTAQNVIEVHIEGSMKGLRCDGKNHVVAQFCKMSPGSVALAGLDTMAEILSGNVVTSAVKLLCFVHVVYALSLVIDEQEATTRSTKLFMQAMSYGSWLSQQDRQAYVQVVGFLWKPDGMPDSSFMELLRSTLSQPESGTEGSKGKAPAMCVGRDFDPLVFVAQYFLDELEASALRDTTHLEIQASDIYMEHLNDINLEAHEGSPFSIAAKDAITCLAQHYRDTPGLRNSMQDIVDRVKASHFATPRRLELELMQAGKMQLPPDASFDKYIQLVRQQVDSLFQLFDTSFGHAKPRVRYYQRDVTLLKSAIDKRIPEGGHTDDADASFDPLSFDGQITHNMEDFFGPMPDFEPGLHGEMDITLSDAPERGASIPAVSIDPPAQVNAAWLPTPEESASSGLPSAAAGTPASSAPTPASLSSKKTEANSCCDICGYRPRGDPRWFGGSMAKHKKLQHGAGPPKIYKCPYPGCTSQYKSRPDNLRQHQLDKGHFVDSDDGSSQRPSKKRKQTD